MTVRNHHLDVRPLLNPRSVAVVGASEDTTRYPGKIMSALQRFGFSGQMVAVNPKYDDVFGVRCVESISAIGEPVDVALIAVSAANSLGVLEEAAACGAKAAVLYASGFAEASEAGEALQRRVLAAIEGTDMIVLGPNTLGAINYVESVALSGAAALARSDIVSGSVGLVTQSGGMMGSILDRGWDFGMGYSNSIATGNEVQLYASDFVSFLADDPGTSVIALFLEGIRNVELFSDACSRAASAGKRLVVLKVGRSERGRSAAAGHTGAIAGNDQASDALFEQCGAIRVESIDELIGVSHLLASTNIGSDVRVGVAALSGGLAGLSADACADSDLELADLSEPTREKIGALQEGFGHAANPLDITGQVVSEEGWKTTTVIYETFLADPNVDCLVIGQPTSQNSDRAANDIAGVAKRSTKPVVALWTGGSAVGAAIQHLRSSGVPTFEDVGLCFGSIAKISQMPRIQPTEELDPKAKRHLERQKSGLGLLRQHSTFLPEDAAYSLLEIYGIRVPVHGTAAAAEDAVRIAERIGFPVVVKAIKPGLLHKSDVGGVRLNLRSAPDVLIAAQTMLGEIGASEVLVSEMASPGVEVLVGMTRDPQVGPIIVIGLGGIFVELLQDTVALRPPFGLDAVFRALKRLRGYPLFDGQRGQAPVDIESCGKAIVAFSQLVLDMEDGLQEAEINPLIVQSDGVLAVDALFTPPN
jgi:acyl-CoA synthetase (NDP forming)